MLDASGTQPISVAADRLHISGTEDRCGLGCGAASKQISRQVVRSAKLRLRRPKGHARITGAIQLSKAMTP